MPRMLWARAAGLALLLAAALYPGRIEARPLHQAEPDSAEALFARGVAEEAQGDHAGAVADFTRVLQADPRNAQAYNNRGAARVSLGAYWDAMDDYLRALSIDPTLAEAYSNRGLLRYALGDDPGALRDLQRAADLFAAQAAADDARRAQADVARLQATPHPAPEAADRGTLPTVGDVAAASGMLVRLEGWGPPAGESGRPVPEGLVPLEASFGYARIDPDASADLSAHLQAADGRTFAAVVATAGGVAVERTAPGEQPPAVGLTSRGGGITLFYVDPGAENLTVTLAGAAFRVP